MFGINIGQTAFNTVLNPATLNLTHWHRNSVGIPWAGVTSAGSSGSHAMNSNGAGLDPTAGATYNMLASASFNGLTTKCIDTSFGSDSSYSTTQWSAIILVDSTAAPVSLGGNADADPCWVSDSGGIAGINFTSTYGVRAFHFTGSRIETPSIALAANTGPHMLMAYFDGSNLNVCVDAGAPQSIASGNKSTGGGNLHVGFGNTTGFQTGNVIEFMTSPINLGPFRTNIKSYFNARYALRL